LCLSSLLRQYLLRFCRSARHRDLHSFPTRRSSDLPVEQRTRDAGEIALDAERPADAIVLGIAEVAAGTRIHRRGEHETRGIAEADRKSTRLNSSHVATSYAVFCLHKKKPAKVSAGS